MISRFAASTVSDTRSTSGSTFDAAGSSEAVMRSTLASVGSTRFCRSSTVLRALRTVMTSSMASQTKATPTTTYTTGNATPRTSLISIAPPVSRNNHYSTTTF